MNKREIASLACKILGIYLIIQGINVMANVLSVSFVSSQVEQGTSIGIIFPYTFPMIFGILLWILSDKLALMLIKEESHSNDDKNINFSEIQRISFSVVGLLFVGNALPKLVSSLTNLYIMQEAPNIFKQLLPSVAGSITQVVLGLGVFLGSQRLINLLNKLKYAGINREEDSFEE